MQYLPRKGGREEGFEVATIRWRKNKSSICALRLPSKVSCAWGLIEHLDQGIRLAEVDQRKVNLGMEAGK